MRMRDRIILLLVMTIAMNRLPGFAQNNDAIQLGIQHFHAQRYDEAKQVFETLAANKNGEPVVAFYLGKIYLREGDYEKAIHWLENATESDTSNSDYCYWLGRAYAFKLQRVGLLKKAAAARQIKTAFERAVQLNPNNLDARMALLQFLAVAPGIIGGSKDGARDQAEQIRQRDDYRGHLAFGLIHAVEERHDLAEQEFRAAIALKPDEPQAYYQLAFLYARQKQWDQAWALMEQLVVRRLDEAAAHFYLGRLAVMSEQKLDQGEQHLKRYLQTEPTVELPSLAFAQLLLGHIYKLRGDLDQAAAEYRKALTLDPNFEPAKKALQAIDK